MHAPEGRDTVTTRGLLQIFAKQTLRLLIIFLVYHRRHAAIKLGPRVGGSSPLAFVHDEQKPLGLIVLHGIVADIVDWLGRLWMQRQSFIKFRVFGVKCL